jgi:hypothetical protein
VDLETAWSTDPERIDPDDFAPGNPFVREMTWAPCTRCNLQVHALVVHLLWNGLVCPRCGDPLLPPAAEPEEWLQRVLHEEDEFSEQL